MKIILRFTVVIMLPLLFTACTGMSKEEATARYLDRAYKQKENVLGFFHRMPKGADLHHHAIGSVMPYQLYEYAYDNGMWVNPKTFKVYHSREQAYDQVIPDTAVVKVSDYIDNGDGYIRRMNLTKAWSMYEYLDSGKNGHDWFFASFEKFKEVFFADQVYHLNRLLRSAKAANVTYLETMINVPNVTEKAMGLGLKLQDSFGTSDEIFKSWEDSLVAHGFDMLVDENIDSLQSYFDRLPQESVVHLNFVGYGLRIYPRLADAFTEMLLNFKTAAKFDRMVGVNFVAPEDNPVALDLYDEHMAMFAYLHKRYPDVKITLHAGELVPELVAKGVESEHLNDHIWQAIQIAGASRIGHGSDLLHEHQSDSLLVLMAREKIAIEVNLTSNEVILEMDSNSHPLLSYFQAGVPVCLSTDDAGILLTSLAEEYLRAYTYSKEIGYLELKQFAYNSIEYSFASESEKEKMKEQLDELYDWFEKRYSEMYHSNKTD